MTDSKLDDIEAWIEDEVIKRWRMLWSSIKLFLFAVKKMLNINGWIWTKTLSSKQSKHSNMIDLSIIQSCQLIFLYFFFFRPSVLTTCTLRMRRTTVTRSSASSPGLRRSSSQCSAMFKYWGIIGSISPRSYTGGRIGDNRSNFPL